MMRLNELQNFGKKIEICRWAFPRSPHFQTLLALQTDLPLERLSFFMIASALLESATKLSPSFEGVIEPQ